MAITLNYTPVQDLAKLALSAGQAQANIRAEQFNNDLTKMDKSYIQNLNTMAVGQGYDLQKMGYASDLDLNKMAVGQGYDLQKIGYTNDLDLNRMAVEQNYNLDTMEYGNALDQQNNKIRLQQQKDLAAYADDLSRKRAEWDLDLNKKALKMQDEFERMQKEWGDEMALNFLQQKGQIEYQGKLSYEQGKADINNQLELEEYQRKQKEWSNIQDLVGKSDSLTPEEKQKALINEYTRLFTKSSSNVISSSDSWYNSLNPDQQSQYNYNKLNPALAKYTPQEQQIIQNQYGGNASAYANDVKASLMAQKADITNQAKVAYRSGNADAAIKQLDSLRDQGVITEEEYDVNVYEARTGRKLNYSGDAKDSKEQLSALADFVKLGLVEKEGLFYPVTKGKVVGYNDMGQKVTTQTETVSDQPLSPSDPKYQFAKRLKEVIDKVAAVSNDRVSVRSPDGQIGTIPASQVAEAKQKGYTVIN